MQHISKWLIFVVIAFIFIGAVSVYSYQSYRHHDITKLMKESARSVITESVNYSLRTDEENVIISEELFEEQFKNRFEELSSSFKVDQYIFEYRKEGDFYKAIKVKIIDEQGSDYETILASNFNNS